MMGVCERRADEVTETFLLALAEGESPVQVKLHPRVQYRKTQT